MSEQEPASTVQETQSSACPHSEAVGKRWGDPISLERQAELQGYLDTWAAETDHAERKGPFDATGLTYSDERRRRLWLIGADVYWLAELSGRDRLMFLPNLHLEGAKLSVAHLEGADLVGSHLEGADLRETHLASVKLSVTHLAGANLSAAHLADAELYETHLEGAVLYWAHLGGAALIDAHLEGADLHEAELEGADLSRAHLEGADLHGASLNSKTVLTDATLDSTTRLSDIQWSGLGAVNLTQLDWRSMRRLGDETRLTSGAPVEDYEAAVRAYRQVAAQLHAQGQSEVTDRFLYRAQVLQRRVLRRRRRFSAALGSWLLDLISGYGYKPMRSLIAYILIILAFTGAYLFNAQFAAPHLTWDEALVLSISAFHGRGVFTSGISLGDTLARLAAGEASIGLLIEITFIATFTQRFFAR